MTIGVGIIGFGVMGRTHARAYQYAAGQGVDVELRGVCSRRADIAQEGEPVARLQRAAEESRQRYAENDAKGRAWLEANRPAWAECAIIAELRCDTSDSQSDYWGHSTSCQVVIGWSKHRRNLFPEMRKAAASFQQTAHLGPGKGRFKPYLAFTADTKANGRTYWAGTTSPWHDELQPGTWLQTREEAEAWIAAKGAPGQIDLGGGVIASLRWEISEDSIEHREGWSMGGGYYLGTGRHSSWVVFKGGPSAALIGEGLNLIESA
jgi:hypothetical protein